MPKSKNFSEDQLREMRNMYLCNNKSCFDIANEFSCGKNTVRKYLLLLGVVFDRNEKIAAKAKGRPSPRKGCKLTDCQKSAISNAQKGNNSCVGRVVSTETRKKISEGNKGKKKHTPDSIARLRERTLGKTLSPDVILKIRISHLASHGKTIDDVPQKKLKAPLSFDERIANIYARNTFKRLLRRTLNMSGKRKTSQSENMLGYSKNDLIRHIESQFSEGMKWGCRDSFHIDHIVPVSAFLSKGIDDPKIVNALINLQPLYPDENRKKSDIYDMNNFESDLEKIIQSIGFGPEMRGEILIYNGKNYLVG